MNKFKSMHLKLIPGKPFDKHNWFESWIGNFVQPLITDCNIKKFWFSRYGLPKKGEIRFRFEEPEDMEKFNHRYDMLKHYIKRDMKDEENYSIVNDLGNLRFLGMGNSYAKQRADLVLNYLQALCQLYMDCLVHEGKGYFNLEKNIWQAENPDGSVFESIHHLFHNITSYEMPIVKFRCDDKEYIESDFWFKYLYGRDLQNRYNEKAIHQSRYKILERKFLKF